MRGEEYESIKSKSRKNTKNSKLKKKKPKLHDSEENAIDIGLGNISTEDEASKRKKQLSLSMAERLQMKSDEAAFVGETKRLKVRGQGTVKEVSFVPKSSRKKMEEKNTKQQGDDRTGRSRRGIRELGFRTPFKHHK